MKPKNKNFVKIAHISDLHFGRFWGAIPDRIGACQRSLAKFNPDVVLVTGDVALFGNRREFLRARDFLDSLPYEKVVVPGNHDVLDGIFLPKINPFRKLRMFNRYLPYKRDINIGNIEIIGMDSTTSYTIGRGHINLDEFKRFSKNKNTIKCIALHHHMIAIPDTGEFNMLK
ncbi:MAG: metallophosphoesterase, partial [Nanoarchaeota archaeon]|nr:metallophosphoesterase [Nanoarchaeota archaeon]